MLMLPGHACRRGVFVRVAVSRPHRDGPGKHACTRRSPILASRRCCCCCRSRLRSYPSTCPQRPSRAQWAPQTCAYAPVGSSGSATSCCWRVPTQSCASWMCCGLPSARNTLQQRCSSTRSGSGGTGAGSEAAAHTWVWCGALLEGVAGARVSSSWCTVVGQWQVVCVPTAVWCVGVGIEASSVPEL